MSGRVEEDVRSLISEVLSENLSELQMRLLTCSTQAINARGSCGETPAHIAIYKNNGPLLSTMLTAGASPGALNDAGNNLIHTATLLGRIELLQILCDTGKCDLEAVSITGQTPLAISQSEYRDEDLVAALLFKNWSSSDQNEDLKASIIEGRKQCFQFLMAKEHEDRERRVIQQRDDISEQMIRRDLCCRWMTDSSGKAIINYRASIDFPTYQGEDTMADMHKDYLKSRKEVVNVAVTRTFCHEQVMNSIFMNRGVGMSKNTP
ncbi:ankyrin repeat domain-containing protein [archaeon]|nr:MAG: ankyrin repeat domain-containing protein [archaeon]